MIFSRRIPREFIRLIGGEVWPLPGLGSIIIVFSLYPLYKEIM
jgi:hypothetical protein